MQNILSIMVIVSKEAQKPSEIATLPILGGKPVKNVQIDPQTM